MFAEKYVLSLTSSNLQDDEHHHHTDALAAAALADRADRAGIGSLLSRVKYADGSISKEFESGTANLAQLLRVWTAAVTEKGRSRGWIKTNNAWDIVACHSLYKRVAEASLAHWLDGKCKTCHGTGVTTDRRFCAPCKGSGRSQIEAGRYESDLIADMVSELEGLVSAHNRYAASRLRKLRE